MARKLRLEYPGAIYHVMSRGDHGEEIFVEDADRVLFLKTLGEVCGKTEWQVHAYCLLSNHFHLVVETPRGNLSAGMKWFLGVFTARYNRRHKIFGHLLGGRYKATVVDGSGNGYLATVCHYVHLNPARAGLLEKEKGLESYPWSSYPEYLKEPGRRPRWLRVERLLGEMQIPKDSPAGRRRLRQAMAERLAGELDQDTSGVEAGWCFGDEEFKAELLERLGERKGKWVYGEMVRDSDIGLAEKLVKKLLKDRGWKEADLIKRRKGDPEKIALARVLKEKSVMTNQWIASRLKMGTRQHLAFLLCRDARSRNAKIRNHGK